MGIRKVSFIEAGSPGLNIFSKFPLPVLYRFGMPGSEVQEKEWKQFLDGLSAVEPSPDYLVADIVLSLARGKPLRESVLFGVPAGTAAVMTPGTELCRSEDAERLYAQMI